MDSLIRLPVSSAAWQVQSVQLGDRMVRLELRWNERAGFWSLDLSTIDREPIVQGVRVVPDWDLLGRYADPRLPRGRLFAQDLSGRGEPPGRDELGVRVVLSFMTDEGP